MTLSVPLVTHQSTLPARARLTDWFIRHRTLLDFTVAFLLALCLFLLYQATLDPYVLDGDQGEYQLIVPVLGVAHPTGFPLYVLLAHLWTLMPFGTLAYRVNLFSAFCAALTVGAFYILLRRMKLQFIAACGGALTLALISQFWRYATVAAVYRLHTFLAVLFILWLNEWEMTRRMRWLYLALFTTGVALSNHLLIVFYGPAAIIFVLLVGGRGLLKQIRFYLWGAAMIITPLLLYFYVPLRGHQLVSTPNVLPGVPSAVAQGFLTPFYQDSAQGLFAYLTGSAFLSTVFGHVTWTLNALVTDWIGNITSTLNIALALVGLVGLVWVLRQRAKLGIFLIVAYLTVQALMLQYGFTDLATIGQFSSYFPEYFLSSFLALVVIVAWGFDAIVRGLAFLFTRIGIRDARAAMLIPTVLMIPFLFVTADEFIARRPTIDLQRSTDINANWQTVKRFAPEQNAIIISHWGDLTPFWYFQYADDWRHDVVGVFPPTDELFNRALASGKAVYIAGPLLGWANQTTQKDFFTPWGPLVRTTDKLIQPPSPLAHEAAWAFEDENTSLRVVGYDLSRTQASVGDTLDLALYWETRTDISLDDYLLTFLLTAPNQEPRATNQTLFVNWLPNNKLRAGQRGLGTYRYAIPWDVEPGKYDLQIKVYSLATNQTLNSVKLAQLQIDPPLTYPDQIQVENSVRANFGNLVALLGWDGDLKQIRAGDQATLQLYWKAEDPRVNTLDAQFELQNDQTSRVVSTAPLMTNARTREGQIVRATSTFIAPADLDAGDYDLVLRVRSGNSSQPNILYNWLPFGDDVKLARVQIVGRPHSYAVPAIPHAQAANFANDISLLGYALDSSAPRAGDTLNLKIFWQAQSLMSNSYKEFVHVLDAQSQVVAQEDRIPGQGALPTTSWLPREVITDSYALTLPKDLPKGEYRFEVGFYNADTLKRLSLVGANRDSVILDSVLQVSQ